MSDLPKGPRRLAIFATELQRKINEYIVSIANYHERLQSAENKIEELKAGCKHYEATIAAYIESINRKNAHIDSLLDDAKRFDWWFHNGDNTDDQLLELKRKRGMGENVTLDEWRNALDGAMKRRK